MADPAKSEDAPAPSDKVPADKAPPKAGPKPISSRIDSTAFANTREHVAGRQAYDGTTERFTNTKLNIALINDPKNGPRFTMTNRESGLGKEDDADKGKDEPETSSESSTADTSPDTLDAPALPPAEISADAGKENETPDPTKSPEPDASKPKEPAKQAALLTKPAPQDMSPAAEPKTKVPIDSSKTFVGHNGTYYDESWRWMDWRGTRRSWNWPAALSLGHWFAYRRLYMFAGVYIAWLAGLAAAAVNDIPILGLVPLTLLVVGLTGIYGNTLYFRAFRRAVDHVTKNGEGSYEELQGQLANAGGTSAAALSIMAILSIASIAGALAATYYLRGGFLFNFWPF